jgi:hypothetical protein
MRRRFEDVALELQVEIARIAELALSLERSARAGFGATPVISVADLVRWRDEEWCHAWLQTLDALRERFPALNGYGAAPGNPEDVDEILTKTLDVIAAAAATASRP